MTDARLKGTWLNSVKFDQLSDVAWRMFTGALMWSAEQGTDGLIPDRYVRLLHPDGDQPDAVAELEAAEFWKHTPDGFQLQGWDSELGQSTDAQVRKYREKNRERQRRFRESKALKSDPAGRDVTRYVGSGLGSSLKEEGESNSRTRPSPFCDSHPRGTSERCIDCMNARLYLEHWEKTTRSVRAPVQEQECDRHPGYPDTKISPCAACARDREEVHA